VVYLSGHGVALPAGPGQPELYCYLTQEARTTDSEQLQNSGVRGQCAVSSEELTEWVKAARRSNR